jgi:large subunit ribosomal protein L4
MTKLNTYLSSGSKKEATNMPKNWQEDVNLEMLAQAIRVYEHSAHTGLSKVKTRSEVAHSRRKIYRQKGTGMARHGDRGAPIFVKGGIAHGPKGVKRSLSLPKKMRSKALKIALSAKAKNGELIFVDNIEKLKKTSDVSDLLEKISDKEKSISENSRFSFVLSKDNREVKRVIRNLKDVRVYYFKNLNAYKVFFGGVLLFDKKVLGKSTASSVGSKNQRKSVKKSV